MYSNLLKLPVTCDKIMPDDNKFCFHYIPTNDIGSSGTCTLSSMFRCPVEMYNSAVKISNSSLGSYMTCNKLYYFHKVLGLNTYEFEKSNPLKMGTLIDKIVECKYSEDGGKPNDKLADEIKNYPVKAQMDSKAVSKVNAIKDALYEYITFDTDNFIGNQCEFNYHILDIDCHDAIITGKYDALYTDHFAELKFTSRPDSYLNPFNIKAQIGTYFLADEKLKYVDMMVIQVPAQVYGKKDTEDGYYKRIYDDVISNPSKYFMGFNRADRTFGKRYYRDEFDLDEILKRYRIVIAEIRHKYESDSWYCNEKSCNMYGSSCEYKSICESGAISEAKYYQDLSTVEFISKKGKAYVKEINDGIDKVLHPHSMAIINPLDITEVIYVEDYRAMEIQKDIDSEDE